MAAATLLNFTGSSIERIIILILYICTPNLAQVSVTVPETCCLYIEYSGSSAILGCVLWKFQLRTGSLSGQLGYPA